MSRLLSKLGIRTPLIYIPLIGAILLKETCFVLIGFEMTNIKGTKSLTNFCSLETNLWPNYI